MKEIEPNRVYTFDEVLELFQFAPTTLRKLVTRGDIPATKLGRHWRFLGSDILGALSNAQPNANRRRENG